MNDQPLADSSRPTHTRYVMLGWLATMCLIAYIHRGCVSVLYKDIQADLHLSKYQLGLMQSAFFWTYAILQIPGAWLSERWGVRKILALDVLFWSISTAFMGACQGFWGLMTGRLGIGVGQAGAFPSAMLAVSRWFPVAQRGLPSGVMTSFMLIGAASGQYMTSRLLGEFSWRQILGFFSLFGIAWSAGFYWWFRETPGEHPAVNDAELQLIGDPALATPAIDQPAIEVDQRNPWGIILKSPVAWLVFAQHFVRAIWTGFLVTQFPEYLVEVFKLPITRAGDFAGGIVIVGVLGNWLGGLTSDLVIRKTGSLQLGRQGLAVGMLIAAGVAVTLPAFVSNIWIAAVLFGLSNILAGIGGPAAYAVTIDIGGRHVSKVFATMNMIGNFGSAVAPLLILAVVDASATAQHVPIPDPSRAWANVPFVFTGVYAVAALCWMGIKTRSLFEVPQPRIEPI